eukprot:TRINITY_DN80549_c1_g1_i1.p1 TRINITY_DN80549_c1_g1~~TRINITY_DN80549_c1_g1_i1.p1  ORF type:complete len:296 (-),score=28.14 TRINITY_DN80549_c1_g1_i1:225-980(-)
MDDYYGDYGYGGYGGYGGGGGPKVDKDPNINGFVQVDDLTFDKIAMGPYHALIVSYDPEDSNWLSTVEELKSIGQEFGRHLNLVLAKVNIQQSVLVADYYKLSGGVSFHYVTEGSMKVEKLDIKANAAELSKILKEKAGEPYTVKALMPVVDKFIDVKEGREELITQAESIVTTLKPNEARVGKWYIKIMNSMIKKGGDYLQKEYERLSNMLINQADSLKAEKLTEFHDRIGVLQVFGKGTLTSKQKKEEL